MYWLTGSDSAVTRAAAATLPLGLMLQPRSACEDSVASYPVYAADNGCFSQGSAFRARDFLAWLGTLAHPDRCLFAVCPDVWKDGPGTVARSLPLVASIRALGLRAAIVAQPGIDVASYPWSSADVLFIGGPEEWHVSPAVAALVEEAQRRGLWCHRGRVNSERRVRATRLMGFDSADGTFLKFGPDRLWPRARRWLAELRDQRDLFAAEPAAIPA